MSAKKDLEIARAVRRARANTQRMKDAAEMLWVMLANVSEGDWSKQSAEWWEAAGRWRDHYFSLCKHQ